MGDLWPAEAVGFIAGAPKSGKTWVGLLLAISVATGERFLRRFPIPEPRPVLYISLEGSRQAMRARVGALARGMGINPDSRELERLAFAYRPPGLNLLDPGWGRWVADTAAKIDAGLVVVDVLRRAAVIPEDGKGAAEFARLLRNLQGVEHAGRSIAFLHHFGKGSETNSRRAPAERMAGSGALFGALDVGVFLTASEGARVMRAEFETRDVQAPRPLTVRLTGTGSGANGGWTYADAITVATDEKPPPTALDVMEEQLRELLAADPTLTQVAAAAKLATVRDNSRFRTAWKRVTS